MLPSGLKGHCQAVLQPDNDSMHAIIVLHRWLADACPFIHRRRLDALLLAVEALVQGQRLTLSDLGRHLPGTGSARHAIKRIDRLLGNRHLHAERCAIYRALAARLLAEYNRPGVHRRFLQRLALVLPAHCRPIIVSDAGFRGPWFEAVEGRGWDWLGRVRGVVQYSTDAGGNWQLVSTLHASTAPKAQAIERVWLGKRRRTRTTLVLIRKYVRGPGRPHRGNGSGGATELSVSELRALPRERAYNVVRLWVREKRLRMPRLQDLEQLLDTLVRSREGSGGLVDVRDYEFRRHGDRLYVLPVREDGEPYELEWHPPFDDLPVPSADVTLTRQACVARGIRLPERGSVTVRSRRGGELIKLGEPAFHKAVKKLLQESGVPPWRRDAIPLLYVDERLAAVWDLAVAVDFRTGASAPAGAATPAPS